MNILKTSMKFNYILLKFIFTNVIFDLKYSVIYLSVLHGMATLDNFSQSDK